MCNIEAYIFDLDGVVVDTAKYHYLAWKRLAAEFEYHFTQEDNEQFKGVGRMDCLSILSKMIGRSFEEKEKIQLADRKNDWYIEYIKNMEKDEVLPGFVEFITEIRKAGGKTALASASKNAALVLERLELDRYFHVVVDGNAMKKSKPDPQVFLLAADRLGVAKEKCLVFEDAQAGIDAAKHAHMYTVGIGRQENPLRGADIMMPGFEGLSPEQLLGELDFPDTPVVCNV